MARTISLPLSFFVLVLQLAQQPCAWCAVETAASSFCGLGKPGGHAADATLAGIFEGGMAASAPTPPGGHASRSTGICRDPWPINDETSLLHISTEVVRGPGTDQADLSLHPPPLMPQNKSNKTISGGLLKELEDSGLVTQEAVTRVSTWWKRVVQVLRDVDEDPATGFPGKEGSYKRHQGQIPDDLVWKRVARTKRISAWDVAHHVKKTLNLSSLPFFGSAGFVDWGCFLVALVFFCRLHMLMLKLPATRGSHSWALLVWMMAGGFYNLIIWTRLGMDAARSWLTGYWLEFIFSMENVFIFHVVASGFRMSWAHSQKALIIVICFQICFQMVFYMGLAELLISIWALPYLLGAWLVYVGWSTLKEEHDHQHSKDLKEESHDRNKQNAEDAGSDIVSVAPFLSGYVTCCRTLLGERFECGYGTGTPSFVSFNGVTRATLLVPAMACLLAVDFVMEVDVTLTKIMEIQHAFIAFTSSVAAAFTVPELFFVAQDLLTEFRLLKYGVSFVLVFFGTLLLLHQVVNLNDMVCVGIIIAVMAFCALLSWLIPPPSQQEEVARAPTKSSTPEDCGVDGCPEVTPESDPDKEELGGEGSSPRRT